jgi:YggT family protein
VTFFLNFVELLCEVLTLVILLRSLASLVSRITRIQNNLFNSVLYQLTEPMLAPLRRILPKWRELDFSPAVVIAILQLIIVIKHVITSLSS